MKKYNVSINDRKFIVNAQDELEAIKKVKDSLRKSTAKDELSNDKLVLLAKAAERAQNDSELKKIIYDVMNYDRTLFNKLLDAYNRDYYDFNHKRHAISTIFTLAIRP